MNLTTILEAVVAWFAKLEAPIFLKWFMAKVNEWLNPPKPPQP